MALIGDMQQSFLRLHIPNAPEECPSHRTHARTYLKLFMGALIVFCVVNIYYRQYVCEHFCVFVFDQYTEIEERTDG